MAHLEDGEIIVKVFDTIKDGKGLDLKDFLSIILPQTNPILKHLAETRRSSEYYNVLAPLPNQIVCMLALILMKEIDLLKYISTSLKILSSQPDFGKERLFNEIS